MLTDPHTGLSLKQLAELELDSPISLPNIQGLKIVSTDKFDKEKYDGVGIELPQIPDKKFIIFNG